MSRFIALAAVALLSTGCYSVQPLSAPTPAPGTRLAVTLNDAGRVSLGGSMGPEIRRIDGSLMSRQDSTYVLSVSGVNYLDGSFQSWKGETVRINPNMVAALSERRFSKGRTIALAGAVVVVGALMLPGKLPGGWPADDDPPPPGSESSIRRNFLQGVQIPVRR